MYKNAVTMFQRMLYYSVCWFECGVRFKVGVRVRIGFRVRVRVLCCKQIS